MSELKAELESLLADATGYRVVDGLMLSYGFPSDCVVNIDRREGELVKADVDAVRAAFTELGYTEIKSWIPMQHVSWMSGGLTAGVSFQLVKS